MNITVKNYAQPGWEKKEDRFRSKFIAISIKDEITVFLILNGIMSHFDYLKQSRYDYNINFDEMTFVGAGFYHAGKIPSAYFDSYSCKSVFGRDCPNDDILCKKNH
ncbi:MAG: hypothetical protein WA055_04875 [Candidatus Moraniibacteriota bacterium]